MWNRKMNLTLAGVAFVDETHSDVGASAFTLNHDWFMNSGDTTIAIRDAAGGGGNLLVEDTDYTISNEDTYLTTETGYSVYSTIQITNAAYQAGVLYFSGKYVADANDGDDVQRIPTAISASATLSPDNLPIYLVTKGTNGIRLTLPATKACEGLIMKFITVDSSVGACTLVPNAAETIGGMAYVFLTEQYQQVEIVSDGTNWQILSGTLYWISGGINTSDWTDRHLGFATVPYDNMTGTFLIGETITEETSGITGVLIADSGSNLTMLKVTGVGYYTNNKTLTGGLSAATALVNTGTTTKNADSACTHSAGRNMSRFDVELWMYAGTTFAWNAARRIGRYIYFTQETGQNGGYELIQTSTSAFTVQTAATKGIFYINDDGTHQVLDNEDYSYCVVAKLVI